MYRHARLTSSITPPLEDDNSLAGIYADRDCLPRKRKSTRRGRVQPTPPQSFVDRGRPRGGIFELAKIGPCQHLSPSPVSPNVCTIERIEGSYTLVLPERQTSASAMEAWSVNHSKASFQGTFFRVEGRGRNRYRSSSSATRRRKVKKSSSSSIHSSSKGLPGASAKMLASCGHHQGNHGDAHPPPFRHGSSTTIPSSQSSSTTRVQHYRSEDSINHVELDHISDESAGLDECTDSSTMPHPQSVIRLNDHTHKGQTSYALEEDCAVGGPESENRWVNGGINNTSWLDDDSASDESESEASVAFWRCEGISEPLNQEDTYEQLVGGIQELAITSSPTKPLLVDIPQRARTSQDFEDLPPAQATNVTTSDLGTTPTDSNSSHKTLSLSIPVITPPETPTGAADLSPELEQHTIPLLNHKNGPDSLPSIYVEAAPTPPTTPGRSQGPPSTIDLPTVLTMLEAAVKGFPFNGLHLEAPIIHLLRSSDSFSAISTAASSPSSSGITWPYSPSFGSTQDGTTLHSPVESKTFQWPPPSSYDSEHHLVPLRKLFPKTEDFFRNDLYAHFLAVTFIDKLPCPKSPLSFITAMPEITSPKALKMLGIAPIRLEKESVEIRVRRVKNGLMTCVGRLLEAMCGKSRSDGDEALIALMDQIVGTVEEGKTPSME